MALGALAALPAFAQLLSHPDAPIHIGHYHLHVTSVEAHKKFWAAVPNVPATATKLAGAGYQETTGREPKPGEPPPAASCT
jgi:hypothetical protein